MRKPINIMLAICCLFLLTHLSAQQIPDSVKKFFFNLPYDSAAPHFFKALERSAAFDKTEFNKERNVVNARILKPKYFKFITDSAHIHSHENKPAGSDNLHKKVGTVTVFRYYYKHKKSRNFEFNAFCQMVVNQTSGGKFRIDYDKGEKLSVFTDSYSRQIDINKEDGGPGIFIITVTITSAPEK